MFSFFINQKVNESSEPIQVPPNALIYGQDKDTQQPVFIDLKNAHGHTLISGQVGLGAKEISLELAKSQIEQDGGLIYIDAFNDSHTIKEIYEKTKSVDRLDDLLIINIIQDNPSNTYNPLVHDENEITRMLGCFMNDVGVVRTFENSTPRLKHLHSIVSALKSTNTEISLGLIKSLISNTGCKELLNIVDLLKAKNDHTLVLNNLESLIKELRVDTDQPKIEAYFEDIHASMNKAPESLTQLFYGDHAKVVLADVIKHNKILVIQLDAMKHQDLFKPYLQLINLDIRNSLELIGGDFDKKKDQPFVYFTNDCINMMDYYLVRLYSYSNPSQFHMVHVSQDPLENALNAGLAIGEYKDTILGNTDQRIALKHVIDSHNQIVTDSFGHIVEATINTATNQTIERSRKPNVPVDALRNLGVGEALVFKKMELQHTIRISR